MQEERVNKKVTIIMLKDEATVKEGRSSSKAPNGTRECFYCDKPRTIKKECYSWLRKSKKKKSKTSGNQSTKSQDATNIRDGYESVEVLLVSNDKVSNDWLLNSRSTYHLLTIRNGCQILKRSIVESVDGK